MYDLIYFCGDSWTVAKNAEGVEPTVCATEETFYYLVSDYFKIPYYNNARGGAGNLWIHNQIYREIPELKKQYKKILSIVGWSDPYRVEIFNNKKKELTNIIDNSVFSLEFIKMYMEQSYNGYQTHYNEITNTYIKSVRALYNCFNIDYIDAYAFTEDQEHINFLGENKWLEKAYISICGDEGRIWIPNINDYGHQNKIGQKKIADALIKKIEKLYGTSESK